MADDEGDGVVCCGVTVVGVRRGGNLLSSLVFGCRCGRVFLELFVGVERAAVPFLWERVFTWSHGGLADRTRFLGIGG